MHLLQILYLHREPKSHHYIFQITVTSRPNFIIIGIHIHEDIRNHKAVTFPTSPEYCLYATL